MEFSAWVVVVVSVTILFPGDDGDDAPESVPPPTSSVRNEIDLLSRLFSFVK
jgi:hypothetical protein